MVKHLFLINVFCKYMLSVLFMQEKGIYLYADVINQICFM